MIDDEFLKQYININYDEWYKAIQSAIDSSIDEDSFVYFGETAK